MKMLRIVGIAGLIVALHLAVLSWLFGVTAAGYVVAACITGVFVWGAVLVIGPRRLWVWMAGGAALGLVVQQVTFHVWRSDLGGFAWPLVQFFSLQYLIAYGLGLKPEGYLPAPAPSKEECSKGDNPRER
jgi:hypothetical protein